MKNWGHQHNQNNGFHKKRKLEILQANSGSVPFSAKSPKLQHQRAGGGRNHDQSGQVQGVATAARSLPIHSAKKRFLEEVVKHETVILIGETGSGKTTQIPQFLHGAKLHLGSKDCRKIGVTQPRRVAAIALARRVNQEMAATIPANSTALQLDPDLWKLGGRVGYKVRFEDLSDASKTEILFQTDGMLLREAMLDPILSKYSWIILDEAHERTVQTDILFGVVKAAQQARRRGPGQDQTNNETPPPLKVIVMSATLEADKFSTYFRQAPVLYVEGRQHPVNVRHVTQKQEDWTHAVLNTVFQIHAENDSSQQDILVFLTGQEEIEQMAQTIRAIVKSEESEGGGGGKVVNFGDDGRNSVNSSVKLNVLPLFASLQPANQQRVFQPSKPNTRKIILSTNIAETSLTIPGVRFVVDSCRVKAKVHQASTGLDMLKVVRVSKAQALQRTGRAGREAEGHCYRMLTKAEFDGLEEATVPEIQRCNLSNVVLQMMSIGIKDVSRFHFLESPPADAVEGALRQLRLLGAVSEGNTLTDLGKKMAAFPLDPKFTKALLAAEELNCTEDVLTIVSMLSGDSILVTPTAKREEAAIARKAFVSSEGDHITLLKVYRAFKASKNEKDFCQHHYVHHRHMQFVLEIRKQLMDLCRKNNVKVQSAPQGDGAEAVRRALSRGLYTNVAKLTREGHYVTLDSRQQVRIHPSSVMFQSKPELVIFTELLSTQKSWIRDLSLVDSIWLMQDQPEYFRKHRIVHMSN